MAVQVPTPRQLAEVATEIGLDLTPEDVASFIGLITPSIAAYNLVDAMPDNLPQVRYPRTPGYRPSGAENDRNAWYIKTTVAGAAEGKQVTAGLEDAQRLGPELDVVGDAAGVPLLAHEAELVGRVGDDAVDGAVGQLLELAQTVALVEVLACHARLPSGRAAGLPGLFGGDLDAHQGLAHRQDRLTDLDPLSRVVRPAACIDHAVDHSLDHRADIVHGVPPGVAGERQGQCDHRRRQLSQLRLSALDVAT